MTAATPGRELLSDDLLMEAIRACGLNGPMRITTIKSRWKDGIDIDEPSYDVRRLATEIADRLAAQPSSDPDAMNERRAAEDAALAANVREACAKVALDTGFVARTAIRSTKGRTERLQAVASEETAQQIRKAILALSTTGEPKQ